MKGGSFWDVGSLRVAHARVSVHLNDDAPRAIGLLYIVRLARVRHKTTAPAPHGGQQKEEEEEEDDDAQWDGQAKQPSFRRMWAWAHMCICICVYGKGWRGIKRQGLDLGKV